MQTALDHFEENLSRARALAGLAHSLSELTTEAIDLTDILRATLVLSVSALDQFVHDFVRLGMLEVHQGTRPTTDAHLSFKVTLGSVQTALADTGRDDWLDEAIRDTHGWASFQHPEKIAAAVRLMSSAQLWDEVASQLGSTSLAVKTQLSAIVDRRNKIAHEADADPTNPGHRWPIDEILVGDALGFLDSVGHAIFAVA